MPEPDKIGQLYDALKADGAIEHQSESDFRSYMGSEANSRALYGALKSDGAIESSSYEDFRDRLGLHAVKPQQPVAKPVQTQVQTQLQPVATGGHDGEGGAIESHGNGRSVGEAQPAPAMASSLPVSGVDVKTVVPDKDGSGNTVGNDNVAPGRGWDVNGKHFTSLDDSLRYIEEQDAIPGRGWKIGDKEFGFNTTGGASEVTLTEQQIPEHTHKYYADDGDHGMEWAESFGITPVQNAKRDNSGATGENGFMRIWNSAKAGESQPHTNLPPYYTLAYIIRVAK